MTNSSEREDSGQVLAGRIPVLARACDHLQRRPAGAGSLCSSPPHPAGRLPRSLCYPAAAVAEGQRGNKPAGRDGRKRANKGEMMCYAQVWQEVKPQLVVT